MALTQMGVRSLVAVNSWIGLINANLKGASRTGFKTVRPHLTDGLGQLYTNNRIRIPPATLNIQATSLEWAQGAIINSDQSTHFALQGQGFFVLVDAAGRYYLTRDGEFHWDGNGYLVNSAGLRVVSSGQDFIRMDRRDRSDIFNPDGASQELLRYGDKSLLIVDVANRDGLRMSQYGSTVFAIDGGLPLRLRNDMRETTDGLSFIYDDPAQLPEVNDPEFITVPPYPPGTSTDFAIDFGDNGVMNFRDYNPLAPGPYPSATPLDFNPATNTINHIIQAINTYGASVGGRVSAYFDVDADRIVIRNEQNLMGSIVNTQIVFLGANAIPVRRFFQLDQNQSSNPWDDNDLDGNLETVLSSAREIDNSQYRQVLDLGVADLNLPLSQLSLTPVHPATYFHDKASGLLQVDATGNGVGAMVIGESQQTGRFDLEFDVKVSAGEIILGFGQSLSHQLDSSGFSLHYNTTSGVIDLYERPPTSNGTPKLLQTAFLPPIAVGAPPLATDPLHRLAISLDENRQITVSLDGATVTFNMAGASSEINGYLSLRNSNNYLQVHRLYANFYQPYNVMRTGEVVSLSPTNYANVEIREAFQERQRTRIIQSALEASTASLTEYVPLLALVQKVFASISKIISAHNAIVDDVNSLVR